MFMKDSKKLIQEGINNLLFNAIKAKTGDRLLIIGEDGNEAHFDQNVCHLVAQTASENQLYADIIISKVGSSADDFPQNISQAMQAADHTIFFSRLGDQIRFCTTPGSGTKTMCYVLDSDYLASDFCRIPHQINQQIYDRLVNKISNSQQFQISCGQGTELYGELVDTTDRPTTDSLFTEFSVNLFPLMIFEPVSCSRMSGKLVIKDWITSSSTIIYEDSVFFLEKPVSATIHNGMITNFDGDAEQCREIETHFLHVADLLGGDAMKVNSWHTGILPSTWYKGRAEDDLEKWGSVSFASPRITHFHACGNDPGQIAFNLFDTTISFDNETLWKNGKFVMPVSDQCDDIFAAQAHWRTAFRENSDIGISL